MRSQVYANSLLLTLNARNAIRKAGQATEQSSFTVPLAGVIVKSAGEESTRSSEDTWPRVSTNGPARPLSDEKAAIVQGSVKKETLS